HHAVRPVCAVVPKIMVTRPRHAHLIVKKFKSPIRRHITRSPTLKTSNSPPRVAAAQALVVSAAKGKKGKWGNPQYALKDKGVLDSGCSRHMTGNMSYLSDFKELNGGYVAFGGNPKGDCLKWIGVFENDVTCFIYLKCWLSHQTTNGSQFTMSNPHKNWLVQIKRSLVKTTQIR
nr:ribonuclease H-like domain-containing protein [Tanacetum cinerariifolium]